MKIFKNMNVIKVPHGVNGKLCDIFGMSRPFVRKCLEGTSRHKLAGRIRKAALENGGVEVVFIENDKKQVIL
jgi:hypothetical protein